MQTRHPASANTLLLNQHRSLAVRKVDMFPSEARPFPGLGTLGGLEQRPNVISEAKGTPAETRSQLDMFQHSRPDGSSWGATLKATGYSNIYKHKKSRQISRSKRMDDRGSARDNEGLVFDGPRLKHSLHSSGPRFPIGGPLASTYLIEGGSRRLRRVRARRRCWQTSLFACTWTDRHSPTWISQPSPAFLSQFSSLCLAIIRDRSACQAVCSFLGQVLTSGIIVSFQLADKLLPSRGWGRVMATAT